MNFNLKIIYGHFAKTIFWIRLWNGWGIVVKSKNHLMLFSERFGYEKHYHVLGFRIKILKA